MAARAVPGKEMCGRKLKKEEFYFDSRDGKTKLHGVRYCPEEGVKVCGVLQIVHGMAEYVERYEEFASFFTAKGIVVTGEDHLGHGKSVDAAKGEKYGYFCSQDPATVLVRDVHRLKKMTQEKYPNVPYVILGHSMGSFITRNYLIRYGTGISAAVIMGTGMQSRVSLGIARAVTRIQKCLLGDDHRGKLIDKLAFGGYNKNIDAPRTPFDWLSRDPERVDAYLADSMCGFVFTVNGFGTLFELVSRLYRAEDLRRIPSKLPVLIVSGTADPVGGYGKGGQRACDSLAAAGMENVKMKMYEGARHELPNEINREEVVRDIYDWMKGTVL